MKPLRARKIAFSLTELMVTVAVLGILSSIVIQVTGQEWRRERVLAVQVDLVGWLEAMRRAALRNGACDVQFINGPEYTPGQILARRDPNNTNCLYNVDMSIPGITAAGTRYMINTTQDTFSFTPRGTVRTVADANLDTGVMIQIQLQGGGPVGCVSLGPSVGAIRSGLVNEGQACRDEVLF
ncbi:MAG: pilus assembly FimT family protein [Prochlorococcaceae cyanobacterium]|jgi:prepilin-type N-terminal cleavage/methylation domain-containing protein